jgi:hypothetical protein
MTMMQHQFQYPQVTPVQPSAAGTAHPAAGSRPAQR